MKYAPISFLVTLGLCILSITSSYHTSTNTGQIDTAIWVYIFIPVWLVVTFFIANIATVINKSAQSKLKALVVLNLAVGFFIPFSHAITHPLFIYSILQKLINSNINIYTLNTLLSMTDILLNWLGLIGVALLAINLLGKNIKYPKVTLTLISFGFIGWCLSLYTHFSYITLVTLLSLLHLMYLGRSYLLTAFNNSSKSVSFASLTNGAPRKRGGHQLKH